MSIMQAKCEVYGFHLYKNRDFLKRDYEATNIVYVVAEKPPAECYVPSEDWDQLRSMDRLFTQSGATYFGYL